MAFLLQDCSPCFDKTYTPRWWLTNVVRQIEKLFRPFFGIQQEGDWHRLVYNFKWNDITICLPYQLFWIYHTQVGKYPWCWSACAFKIEHGRRGKQTGGKEGRKEGRRKGKLVNVFLSACFLWVTPLSICISRSPAAARSFNCLFSCCASWKVQHHWIFIHLPRILLMN